MLTARDVMTRDVRSARAEWSLEELASFLTSNAITGAPVLDSQDKLVGIVSTTDLVRNRMPDHLDFPDSAAMHDRAYEGGIPPSELEGYGIEGGSTMSVAEIMTPIVFDCAEDTPVNEIADAMIRGRIHRVVVTRRGRAVGIVSSLDLLRIVRDMSTKAAAE